jgi:replicative DNA helicase
MGAGAPLEDADISYSTVSERHARQLKHLLLRFGVIAKLSGDPSDHEAAWRQSWRLEITGTQSFSSSRSDGMNLAACFNARKVDETPLVAPATIEFFSSVAGNQSSLRDAGRSYISTVGLNPRLSSRRRSATKNGFTRYSDIYWDEIVSIEYLGDKKVYDPTIPETHNFVANDICVHNTAFSLNIAQNAATRPQHNGEKAVVGVFSLEMSNEQLVNRLLCSQARVDAHRLRSGYLNKDEWRRLAIAVGELAETKIYLDDTPGISVLEMRAKARRLKNEQKALDLIIIDYLQLMSGRGRNESRQQEVSQISRELKILAKELNVPLIALSQLSRAPETRTGSHKPQLSDLRESGSIEQDADVVMFIYREEVYKPETEKQNIAEIIIGKQRNGPIGSVELVFLKQLTRFEDKFNEQA